MVHQLYLVPKWFVGFDITLEFLFALATLLVSYYAYKVYKLSSQREAKIFSISFLFIAISYIAWALVNMFVAVKINENKVLNIEDLWTIMSISNFAVYLHFVFFMIGLITLAYLTFKIRCSRDYFLILSLAILGLVLSCNIDLLFYLYSSLIILMIVYHYFNAYKEKQNKNTLRVLIAFIFLFLGSITFLLIHNNYIYYIIGHLFKLIAYVLILVNLLIIIKKKK